MSGERTNTHLITAELSGALDAIEPRLRAAYGKDIVLLSDFDYTLCDRYSFDAASNNHLAEIDPSVVAAAEAHHLVVATSRRVDNPTVARFWQSGLVPSERPVIVENGGAILFQSAQGELECIDMVRPQDLEELQMARELASKVADDAPAGQRLIFKAGRTMLLARFQDEHGNTLSQHQRWLAERLRAMMPLTSLQIVDTRASVTIQHKSVNKGAAFRTYLDLAGVPRERVFVVGLGDGENDAEIFGEADLSLGFSEAVSKMVDVDIPHGPRAVPHILRLIERHNAAQMVRQ